MDCTCRKCGRLVKQLFKGYCRRCAKLKREHEELELHLNGIYHQRNDEEFMKDPPSPFSYEWCNDRD